MNIQPTSLQAYFGEVVPSLGNRQKIVIEAFLTNTFTNAELGKYLGWPINTVTPRVKELRDKGYLVEDCVRPCKVTGRNAKVWKLKNFTQQMNLL